MLRVSSETVKTLAVCWKKSAVSCIRKTDKPLNRWRGGSNQSTIVILSEAKNPATSINFELNLSGQIYSLFTAKPAPVINSSGWMFESLASCFAFRCSASLNMTGYNLE
jgi:hypothetical protein